VSSAAATSGPADATGAGRGSFTVRRCGPSESNRLSSLASRLFVQAYGPTHPEPTLSVYLAESFAPERLAAELSDTAVSVFVAEDSAGDPIGYAWLRDWPAAPPAEAPSGRGAEIVRFYVDDRWHGRGVALALVAACDGEAASRGADVLWLSVWQEAARPIAFYAKAGFTIVGTSIFRFGERIDNDYVMARAVGR